MSTSAMRSPLSDLLHSHCSWRFFDGFCFDLCSRGYNAYFANHKIKTVKKTPVTQAICLKSLLFDGRTGKQALGIIKIFTSLSYSPRGVEGAFYEHAYPA